MVISLYERGRAALHKDIIHEKEMPLPRNAPAAQDVPAAQVAPAVDCHTHSLLSPDGHNEPMEMAARAFGLGIKHYAITDHIETEKLDEWDCAGALEKSRAAFEQIKERFAGKMNVYYGAELGQPLYNLPRAEEILARYDFDFVLGSQHRTKTYPYLDKVPDTPQDRRRCLDEYFEEELALAEYGKFCSLSHLTFPLRFLALHEGAQGKPLFENEMSRYKSIIDKIFETIISKDIALEVNSSGIRKGLGVPMPAADYVRRYRALGGKMITLGSDAHYVNDVGADISKCVELIKDAGFSEICVFSKKEPIFITI